LYNIACSFIHSSFKVQLLVSLSSLSLPGFIIPSDFFENLVKSTVALFVVIDPIGNVPLFIALTQNMRKMNERQFQKLP
jgi:MarC family integral membrane protein